MPERISLKKYIVYISESREIRELHETINF